MIPSLLYLIFFAIVVLFQLNLILIFFEFFLTISGILDTREKGMYMKRIDLSWFLLAMGSEYALFKRSPWLGFYPPCSEVMVGIAPLSALRQTQLAYDHPSLGRNGGDATRRIQTESSVAKCVNLAYFPLKNRLMRSTCCLCVCESPLINFWKPEQIFMKLGMYIVAPEPISTAYFLNPSHQSVSVSLLPLPGKGSVKCILAFPARQQLDKKNVNAATNTHATVELLNASFSMRSGSSKESTRLVLPRNSCLFISRSSLVRAVGINMRVDMAFWTDCRLLL
jgi:hypothetical protein